MSRTAIPSLESHGFAIATSLLLAFRFVALWLPGQARFASNPVTKPLDLLVLKRAGWSGIATLSLHLVAQLVSQ